VTELAATISNGSAGADPQQSDHGPPYAARAERSRERVNALRRAFDAVLKDPRFVAEAEKQQLEVRPSPARAAGMSCRCTVAAGGGGRRP